MSKCTEELFLSDVENHVMTIIRDDGVNRHVRFGRPDTTDMRFDLITWPGYLCYCGDMGTFVFHRLEDMFTFFRKPKLVATERLYINTGYWGEKCEAVDSVDGIRKYCADSFSEVVNDILDRDEDMTDELRQAVEDEVLSYADDGECAARDAAESFEFNGESYFRDFWETTLTVKSYRFVWCCYALAWSVAKYDSEKLTAV